VSYGVIVDKPCPDCGTPLDYVDYTQDPPPIPPGRRGYEALNGFVNDEGRVLCECPTCEADLL
jgi:hypothetical protein